MTTNTAPHARPVRRRAGLAIVGWCLALSACGAGTSGADEPSAAAPVVAVLPPVWLTESPMAGVDAGAAALAGVVAAGARTADPVELGAALPGPIDPGCLDEPACVRRLGESAGAGKALLVRLAGLGDTVAVRLVLVDVRSGAEEASREDVVRDATTERVAAAVEAAARSLAAPLAPPPPQPWYEDWRLWVGIGAGALAAGGAAAAGVLLAPSASAGPDVTVNPP